MAKRKQKIKIEDIEFTEGSGNVYADFGFKNPEEARIKAELAMLITQVIKKRRLSQQQAAKLMGIDQPKISKITRGNLSEFTIERLMKFILFLGFDLEITPKRHFQKSSPPTMHITTKMGGARARLMA